MKRVAAGLSHSIVLKDDDNVWATVKNSYGQLGEYYTCITYTDVEEEVTSSDDTTDEGDMCVFMVVS